MAKIKVYELAKELGVESKEILASLKNKGIEVKSHMSVLEDGQVQDIKNSLKAPAKSDEAFKAEKKEHAETTEHVKTEEAPAKKKKNIIFVSNPNNSKLPGSQIPRKPAKPATQAAASETHVKHQEPVQSQPVETAKLVETAKPVETEKPAETVKPVEEVTQNFKINDIVGSGLKILGHIDLDKKEPEAPKSENSYTRDNRRPYNNDRPNNGTGRPYNNNGTGRPYNNDRPNNGTSRPYNNDRPNNGTGRPYNNDRPNNGTGRPYNNDRPNNGTGRPYNNDRPNNGAGRPYNNDRPNNGTGRPYNNDRPNNGTSRPYNNNGTGRPYNNDRPNNGTGRPYNNNGTGRPYNNNGGQGSRPGQGYAGGRGGFDKDKDMDRNERGGQRQGAYNKKPAAKGFPETPIKDTEKHRDEEKRRISQEKDKKNRKDSFYEEDGDIAVVKGKNKAGKFIKPEKKIETVEEQIKVITLPETLTIRELAEKMKMQPSAIVKKLFLQGQIVTVNQEITYETAENIAIDYDIICEQEVKVDVIEELLKEDEEKEEDLITRPPVICVMGHVDHGKTSLLDAIRKTNVTDREAGGITQHIGAYTVNVNNQKITFLDTPGHEAFTAMRMRGANSTDIAILVVAADDGVMPQTVEAINHAKAAGIQIIVAVNKIDKPGANIERVKQELTEYELIAEDWGGDTVFVPVSAKTGEGIENLLEMILLSAEVLELKSNPNRRARGLVIEAQLDKGRGPVATILVQKGTLNVGDFVSAGAASGKVRAMIDDKGRRVKEAGPSTPVEILGLGDVPNAGEIFLAHENDKEAKLYADTFISQNREKLLEDTKAKMSLDDLFSQIQAGNLKELDLIIKADVQGSVEAVKQSLLKLSNEEVVVKCIHGGVGAINESDVTLASASNAIIIGFNVRPDAQAKVTSEREGVDVRLYKVIYQAIEDIEAAMKGMLDPVFEEKVIGHAEVRQIFKASALGNIAGSYVLDGMFQRGCKVRITREGEQIYEGELASLKRFKDDVKEVKAGFECGLVFDGFDQMQELDIVEAYMMVEVPR